MQLIESIPCLQKAKSRKTLNVSREVANITAEQIEAGVTLEVLKGLNVPVYTYSTQITIHGVLPEVDSNKKQAGYKAIVQNGNGSIGVKYCGIDATKKDMLLRVVRLPNPAKVWHASRSSAAMSLTRWFENSELQKAREAAKELPLNKMIASAAIFRAQLGGIALVVDVKALPQESFEEIVLFFSAGKTVADYKEYDQRMKQESEARTKKYNEEAAAARAEAMEAQSKTLAEMKKNRVPLSALPALPCTLEVVKGALVTVYNVKKWGDLKVRYTVDRFPRESRSCSRQAFLANAFAGGRVFEAEKK